MADRRIAVMGTRLRRAKAILHSIKCRHLLSSVVFIVCYLTCVFILRNWLTWEIYPYHPSRQSENVKNDVSLFRMPADIEQTLNEPDLKVARKYSQSNKKLSAKELHSGSKENVENNGRKSLANYQNVRLLNGINLSFSEKETSKIGEALDNSFQQFTHEIKDGMKVQTHNTKTNTVQGTSQLLKAKVIFGISSTAFAGQTGLSASKSQQDQITRNTGKKKEVEMIKQMPQKAAAVVQSLPKAKLLHLNHRILNSTASQASVAMTTTVKPSFIVQLTVSSIPRDPQSSVTNFHSKEEGTTRATKVNQQEIEVSIGQKVGQKVLKVSPRKPSLWEGSATTGPPMNAGNSQQEYIELPGRAMGTKKLLTKKKNKTNGLENLLNEHKNASLVRDAEPLCKIPMLDPFDDVIRKAITKVNVSQRCPSKKQEFGKVSRGMLHVSGKGILHASVYFPRRSRGQYPDFYLDDPATTTFTLTNHNTKPLAKGEQGCLVAGSKIVTFKGSDIHLSSEGKCTGDILFQWTDNRKLKHLRGGKCITTADTISSLKRPVMLDTCSDVQNITNLQFQSNGTTQSGCLMVDSYDQLSYASVCNGSTKVSLSFILAQDLNTSLSMNEDGAHLHVITTDGESNELFLHASHRGKADIVKDSERDKSLPNIVMIILEAQSAANAERSLSATLRELRRHPMSVLMKGHTINGDGTTAQLCAMLIGKQEHELPEARRGKDGANVVDLWPFIFKKYRDRGYVTAFLEDDPDYGAFNYRLFGFNNPPTDHYPRSFWQHARKNKFVTNPESCILDSFSHEYSLDYISSLYDAYPSRPKFIVSVTARLSHDHPEYIAWADSDIAKWLRDMRVKNRLNNTLIMIAGDHGPRIGSFRATLQGKLEERLPFLSVSLPFNWKERHPDYLTVLKANSQGLTTHFDIHSSLLDIIHSLNVSLSSTRGQSLFRKIDPSLRTCSNAGIDEHWCPCLNYEALNISDPIVQELGLSVVEYMNNLTKANKVGRELCAPLSLQHITRASKKMPNKKVQKFLHTVVSEDCDSCKIELAPESVFSKDQFTYEIVFSAVPSNGTYEATVRVHEGKIFVDENISRTNKYGNQPWCIQDKFPGLRKFCFCKEQRGTSV